MRLPLRKLLKTAQKEACCFCALRTNNLTISKRGVSSLSVARKRVAKIPAETIRNLFNELEQACSITKPEEWYEISLATLSDRAKPMLKKYSLPIIFATAKSYFALLLKQNYPHLLWNEEQFKLKMQSNPDHRRSLLQSIEEELGVKNPEDWAKFDRKDAEIAAAKRGIEVQFRSMLVSHYQGSLFRFLRETYPESITHKFQSIVESAGEKASSPQFMRDRKNQRLLLETFGKMLNVTQYSDWYGVSLQQLRNAAEQLGIVHEFIGLTKTYYNGNVVKMITTLLPEHPWEIFRFAHLKSKKLYDVTIQRKMLRLIEQELGITNPSEEWYNYSKEDVLQAAKALSLENSTRYILTKFYGGSIPGALMILFPEYQLKVYGFRKTPKHAASLVQQKTFMKQMLQSLETALMIERPEDWYRISNHQISKLAKFHLVQKYGGLAKLLPTFYPDFSWEIERFGKTYQKKAQQRLLFVTVRKIFGPEVPVLEDYFSDTLSFGDTKEAAELDIFVPSLKLAFEYHGIQHYKDVGVFATHREYELRDNDKKKACEEAGITLLEIPFSWDSSEEYVRDIIRSKRPELRV